MVESGGHDKTLHFCMVRPLALGRWHITDGFKQTPMGEPVDPFKSGELDLFEVAPWPTPPNRFGLGQADDGLGRCMVVSVPTLPTEGSIPAFTRRAVERMARY